MRTDNLFSELFENGPVDHEEIFISVPWKAGTDRSPWYLSNTQQNPRCNELLFRLLQRVGNSYHGSIYIN